MDREALDPSKLLAAEAERAHWSGLAHYFSLRSSGLRKPALLALDDFLREVVRWSFDERLRLTRWVVDRCSQVSNGAGLLPQPLLLTLISPTIWEWVEREPLSAEAHFLAGTRAVSASDAPFAHKPFHLRRAIALDPEGDAAKVALLNWLTADSDYNQHELPWGYLGDAEADLEELGEAAAVAAGISNPELRKRAEEEVSDLRQNASTWLAFRKSGCSDFEQWCVDQGQGGSE